jgi:O-antigen/teichoic acid export membrane protein
MLSVRKRSHIGLAALAGFFAVKVLLALIMLKLSAQSLSAEGFTIFSQLLMFSALLNTVASGGMQNGLVREVSRSDQDAAVAFAAAHRIWLIICCCGIVLAAFSIPLAKLLVDDTSLAWTIPLLIIASALTGLGQLYTAVLIGRNRLAANSAAQLAGLLVGTLCAVPLVVNNSPAIAVIAFATGNCVTAVVARICLEKSPYLPVAHSASLEPMLRQLLGYSGSFVFAAASMPLILFCVRYVYRDVFGVEALSEWLVANRISDVSTQMLGLFMAQWYLPHLARSSTKAEANRTTLGAVAIAVSTMTAILVFFLAGASVIIPLVLSEQFLSARSNVAIYMFGDVLRVATSAALFAALARGRLWAYVAIEGLSAALFGLLAIGMIMLSISDAPFFAHVATYGILSVLIGGRFLMYAR